MSISISNTTQSTGHLWWKGEDHINQADLTGSQNQNFKIKANVDANKVTIQTSKGEDLITFSRDGDKMNVEKEDAFKALNSASDDQLLENGFQLGQFDIRLEPETKLESHRTWIPPKGTEDYSNHLIEKPDWTTGTIFITDRTTNEVQSINW